MRGEDPGRRFIGFHREQVLLAGDDVGPGCDLWQTVWQRHTKKGRRFLRTSVLNMAGERVPDRLRMPLNTIRRSDVLFREGWDGEEQCPSWIPRPTEEAVGSECDTSPKDEDEDEDEGSVQSDRVKRRRVSRNQYRDNED